MKENLDIGNMIPGGTQMSDNGIIEKYCYDADITNCETECFSGSSVSEKMRALTIWDKYCEVGTDDFGFKAPPVGRNDYVHGFGFIELEVTYWSATVVDKYAIELIINIKRKI